MQIPPYSSIHAPRAGSDDKAIHCKLCRIHFNPRSPCGERPGWLGDERYSEIISIHAPRTGSDRISDIDEFTDDISIHAPRAGSDVEGEVVNAETGISIHAPRAGSDDVQSEIIVALKYFNPRSPCGERRCVAMFVRV